MMKICGRIATSAILLCLAAGAATAQQGGDAVPLDAQVTRGTLPNGFTYYIRRNNYPEKRAVMYLVNKVGSVLETDEQRGLAHFLEHMAFNGTTHYPKNQLVDYLQKSGVRFGADLNATTSFTETIYQLPVSVEDKTVFRNALQILRDWAQGITLEDEEIDKERGVILEEKRQRLGASQRVQDKVFPLITNGSVFAARMPIGTEEVLQHFKHEEIRKFYHDWYRPDLQALIIVGDVNVQAVEKTIRSMFSDLKMPSNPKPRPAANIPLTNRNQFIAVTDPELGNASLEMTSKLPGRRMETVEDFKAATVVQLFNMMVANRFNELQQLPDAPFMGGGFNTGKMMAGLDALNGKVSLKPGAYEKGVKAWWTELERIKRYGFTPKELKRATVSFMSGIDQTYKEREKIPSESYVREYVQHFLENVGAPGISYEAQLYRAFTDTLTVASVNRYMAAYLVASTNRDFIITAGDKLKDQLPTEAQLQQWLGEAAKEDIAAYKDKQSNRTTIFTENPVAGTITSEKKLAGIGTTELVLSNGVKVLLKPTTYKKDQVLFSAVSPGGLSLVSDDNFYNARIAAGLVSASGIADMTLQELRDLLTGKHVSVLPYISDLAEGMSGETTQEDLETALQMVYLYFTKPRKDPVAFTNMIEQTRVSFNNPDQSPRRLFNDTLSAVLADYHFRKMKMPPEKLDLLDADKALAIYKERFADAADFTFIFAGSFDTATIKPLLTRYLGSLPSLHSKEEAHDLHLDYPRGRITRKVVKGKEPQSEVMLAFTGSLNYDPKTAVQLRALASVLTIRLTERLREQEGGVYGVRANTSLRKLPSGEYAIFVNFICDPRNVEPLILSVNSEIMKLKMEGPPSDDIVKVKAGDKGSLERAMKENAFWTGYLVNQLISGEPLEVPDTKKQMQSVTTESLQQTAVKYFNNANYIRVVLVPDNN